ncbi:MAG: hypothetical protein ACKVRO_06965 [Micropepsaceae bacterium]
MDGRTVIRWVQIGGPVLMFFLGLAGISSGNMYLVGVGIACGFAAFAIVMLVPPR